MKTQKLQFGILTLLLLTFVGAINYSQAQNIVVLKGNEANPAGGAITADDTSVALLVRYIGTSAGGGEVAVAAGGDLTFTVATAADTTFECPVSGGLGGVIDVSDAACNTLGEVCDVINGVNPRGTSDFRCVILNGLRTDSSDDTLNALSITAADAKGGLGLFWDSDVALHSTYAVLPLEARSLDFYVGAAPAYSLKPKPFANTRTFVDSAWEDTSTCTGADTFRIVTVSDYSFDSEGTVQNIFGPIATNTTTPVAFTLPQGGVFGKFGGKVLAREACASSFVGGLLSISGYQVPSTH